ncbi:MAG TPA: uracil-DNA glycosylase, partial [Ktedonobacterales bacterium]|nr:uracil-DNA glycosylase [Ktedonobacterales bacterium]
GRIVVAMFHPAAALHKVELRKTIEEDFKRAIPAALSEARRLAAEGKLGQAAAKPKDEPPPQQLTLF